MKWILFALSVWGVRVSAEVRICKPKAMFEKGLNTVPAGGLTAYNAINGTQTTQLLENQQFIVTVTTIEAPIAADGGGYGDSGLKRRQDWYEVIVFRATPEGRIEQSTKQLFIPGNVCEDRIYYNNKPAG